MTFSRTKVRSILILAGIVLALAVPLMFLLEDFIRDAIVTPLAYQAWLLGIVLGALPPGCFLAPVIGLVAFLSLRSLQRQRTVVPYEHPVSHPARGRVKVWYERIEHVSRGSYSMQRLAHNLGQLTIRVIAYEERLSLREATRLVQLGEIHVPDSVQECLELAVGTDSLARRGWFARLKSDLLDLAARCRSGPATTREAGAQIALALAYVEEQLRIEHSEVEIEQQRDS